MKSYFIDKSDPQIDELFRRMEKAGKALDKLETSIRPVFNGQRFITDTEFAARLNVSRRTLQDYPAPILGV